MDERARKPRRLSDIVAESQYWDAEDLLRNLDEELDRLEHGIGHMIWGIDEKPVTMCLRPLPITPRFKIDETSGEFKLVVQLPQVPEENVRLSVDKRSVEVFACSDHALCRPYYVSVDSRSPLDPNSANAEFRDHTYIVSVKKAQKRRVPVK